MAAVLAFERRGARTELAQRRFTAAQRRGVLCVVASHDGRAESLQLHANVLIYSAILEPGQHVVHELAPGRASWVQVVFGECKVGDSVLSDSDAAAITAERSVSLTALRPSEILLLDLSL